MKVRIMMQKRIRKEDNTLRQPLETAGAVSKVSYTLFLFGYLMEKVFI
jgi:hypothetical protein